MRYGVRLESAMEKAGVSTRSLARQMRPESSESMRRLLRRYVTGERNPGPTMRAEISGALRELGADTAELDRDDDEEAELMMADLIDALQELERVRERIGRVLLGDVAP